MHSLSTIRALPSLTKRHCCQDHPERSAIPANEPLIQDEQIGLAFDQLGEPIEIVLPVVGVDEGAKRATRELLMGIAQLVSQHFIGGGHVALQVENADTQRHKVENCV